MEDDLQPDITASEARRKARENLREDRARWDIITPITRRLRDIRTEDALSTKMSEEWRYPR